VGVAAYRAVAVVLVDFVPALGWLSQAERITRLLSVVVAQVL
jgi:hypothetical protein